MQKKNIFFLICLAAVIICFFIEIKKQSNLQFAESEWDWFINFNEYEDIILLNENFIAVKDKSGKYGVINKQKKMVINCQYKYVLGISEQIIRVLDFNGNYLFFDGNTGAKISENTYEQANDFYEEKAAVQKEGKWGFINTQGEIIIDYQFDDIKAGFFEKRAAVKKDNMWFFIDEKGNKVFDSVYDNVKIFQEGYAGVEQNGKWGFINHEGELVIDLQYGDVGNFSEHMAAVKIEKQGMEMWGYIDEKGDVVIDFSLFDATDGRMVLIGEFHNGYALVTKSVYCLIDAAGNVILGENSYFLTAGSNDSTTELFPAYDYIDEAMEVKKYGLIDIDGNEKLPFQFDGISEVCGNLAVVTDVEDEITKIGVVEVGNNK